jgi:CYTH domain-containing protein
MKKIGESIRREFILLTSPPSWILSKGLEIEEGFVVSSPLRVLRLCREGTKYVLSFREKQSSSSHHQEIKITSSCFKSLWPLTEGRRVKYERSFLRWKQREIKIDRFLEEHAPLQLVEVVFSTLKASRAFKKPSFFGEEVTGCRPYDIEEMALYGAPKPLSMSQIGVFPYLIKRGKLHVLLVTSSSGKRWIIPKGHHELGMRPEEVAIMEAVEEGGVVGMLHRDLHLRGEMVNGRFLQLYAMKISKLLSSWPEKRLRLRRLVPLERALQLIDDPEMADVVRRLAIELKRHCCLSIG